LGDGAEVLVMEQKSRVVKRKQKSRVVKRKQKSRVVKRKQKQKCTIKDLSIKLNEDMLDDKIVGHRE